MHTNTYLYVGMCVYVNQHIGFNSSTLTRTANGRKKVKKKQKRYNNNSNTVYVGICIRVARRVIHINVIIYLTLKTAKFKAS